MVMTWQNQVLDWWFAPGTSGGQCSSPVSGERVRLGHSSKSPNRSSITDSPFKTSHRRLRSHGVLNRYVFVRSSVSLTSVLRTEMDNLESQEEDVRSGLITEMSPGLLVSVRPFLPRPLEDRFRLFRRCHSHSSARVPPSRVTRRLTTGRLIKLLTSFAPPRRLKLNTGPTYYTSCVIPTLMCNTWGLGK
jgi:hypothetical protein